MRHIEVRRHTMRTKPGQHLSVAGIQLARRVAKSLGSFDLVITSTVPRAYETAVAMGLDVDEQLKQLSLMGDAVDAEIPWPASFSEFAQVIPQGGATARFAEAQATLWRSIVQRLPDGGQALVITHGGVVEAGAVACMPDADHHAWGPHCGYCEGVCLGFDGERFTQVMVRRVKRAR